MPLIHDETGRRFTLQESDGEAVLTYERQGGHMVVTHTFVPPEWRGRGVAERLMRAALDWADPEHLTVGSRCSYATAYLERHSEYSHLVD